MLSEAKNLSLFLTFIVDGYITCNVYKRSISQELFIDFLG